MFQSLERYLHVFCALIGSIAADTINDYNVEAEGISGSGTDGLSSIKINSISGAGGADGLAGSDIDEDTITDLNVKPLSLTGRVDTGKAVKI